ncbi:MAG: hypothetical protein WC539_10705 [Nitrospirota bacterium]
MDYAYQAPWTGGNMWSDFYDGGADPGHRKHIVAYPTVNGVIDTVQWEGWREGVDDVRYLTTLQNTIETARTAGKDVSGAENWLANLKKSNLSTQNLDTVRQTMVNYIIALQGGAPVIVVPTVTTSLVTGITTATAASGGNVTSDGGAAVTARGVCVGTSPNPTTSCTSNGTGTGAFTSSITGLSNNTYYHVRAYATNSAGTGYGNDATFTTGTRPQPPVLNSVL